jgi:hypothetical protein
MENDRLIRVSMPMCDGDDYHEPRGNTENIPRYGRGHMSGLSSRLLMRLYLQLLLWLKKLAKMAGI